jgi:hypothetical protein
MSQCSSYYLQGSQTIALSVPPPMLSKKQKQPIKLGMSIIFNPKVDTFKQDLFLQFTYTDEDDNKSLVSSSNEYMSRSRYRNVRTVEYTLCSSGLTYGMTLSNSLEDFHSFEFPILPGWNGKLPIFIPTDKCTVKIISKVNNNNNNKVVLPPKPTSAATSLRNSKSAVNQIALTNGDCIAFSVYPASSLKAAVHKLYLFTQIELRNYSVNKSLIAGTPPLNLAALHGNILVLLELLRNGASVHKLCSLQRTALHESITGGHLEVVQILLDQGAIISKSDYMGRNSLHVACFEGNIQIIRVLLKVPVADLCKALVSLDRNGKKPIDLIQGEFSKEIITRTMKFHKLLQVARRTIF